MKATHRRRSDNALFVLVCEAEAPDGHAIKVLQQISTGKNIAISASHVAIAYDTGFYPPAAPGDACYSADNETFHNDLESVVSDKEVGDTIWIGEQKGRQPSYYFDIDWLKDDMRERAHDDCGESADDFPDQTKEKWAELESIIEAWLDANLNVTFYQVENVREVAVTADML